MLNPEVPITLQSSAEEGYAYLNWWAANSLQEEVTLGLRKPEDAEFLTENTAWFFNHSLMRDGFFKLWPYETSDIWENRPPNVAVFESFGHTLSQLVGELYFIDHDIPNFSVLNSIERDEIDRFMKIGREVNKSLIASRRRNKLPASP